MGHGRDGGVFSCRVSKANVKTCAFSLRRRPAAGSQQGRNIIWPPLKTPCWLLCWEQAGEGESSEGKSRKPFPAYLSMFSLDVCLSILELAFPVWKRVQSPLYDTFCPTGDENSKQIPVPIWRIFSPWWFSNSCSYGESRAAVQDFHCHLLKWDSISLNLVPLRLWRPQAWATVPQLFYRHSSRAWSGKACRL